MTPYEIAKICHESNRAYCRTIGDFTQVHWGNAPDQQQKSAINGVHFMLDNPQSTPRGAHENWLREKMADGWKYGPTKDPESKLHPCIVSYDELPQAQRAKDALFCGIVRALAPYMQREHAEQALGSVNDGLESGTAPGASVEQDIQAKGLTAARITPADIEAQVSGEFCGRASDLFKGCPTPRSLETLTICVLALRNGFTVVGTSACVSPENYDEDLGRRIARQKAVEQIWPLLGYELKSKLAAAHGSWAATGVAVVRRRMAPAQDGPGAGIPTA